MEDIQFTDQELEYINADIYDKTQPIYAYATSRESKILPTRYNVRCTNIPKGKYIVNSTVNFHKSTLVNIAWGNYYRQLTDRYTPPEQFGFDVWDNCEFLLKSKFCKQNTIQEIIHSLRTQSIINARNLSKQQESLIQRDIKTHTDLGEDYNRESFFRTI